MRVTPREAAKELGVSTDTLRRWAEEGRITVELTAGGHRRYDLAEIRRMLAGPRDEAASTGDATRSLVVVSDPAAPAPGLLPVGSVSDTASYEAFTVETPLALRVEDLNQHLVITGRTGTGKSELLKRLAVDAFATHPTVVVDPHGAAADQILDYVSTVHPERAGEVVIADFRDPEHPVAFNPLDVASLVQAEAVVNAVTEMFASVMQLSKGSAPRAVSLAQLALIAFAQANLAIDDPDRKLTLMQLVRFFIDTEFRQMVVALSSHVGVREMFDPDTGPFEMYSDKQRAEMSAPIIRATQSLTASSEFAATFSASRNQFKLGELVRDRRLVLVKLPSGLSTVAGHAIGSLVLSYLLATFNETGVFTDRGPGLRVFVDEALPLITYDSPVLQMLAESRKFDVGFVFATQTLTNHPKHLVDMLLANSASKITFAVDVDQARVIAPRLDASAVDLSAADLTRLRSRQMVAVLRTGWAGAPDYITPPLRLNALPALTPPVSAEGALTADRCREQSRLRFRATAPAATMEETKAALTAVLYRECERAAGPSGLEIDLGAEDAMWDDQSTGETPVEPAVRRLALTVNGDEAAEFPLDGEPPAQLLDSWRRKIEQTLADTLRGLDTHTRTGAYRFTAGFALDGNALASFATRTPLYPQYVDMPQLQGVKALVQAAAIDINRALKPADPGPDDENLWPEDPRYMGMFTIAGNAAVCELVSQVIDMARSGAARDEVEQTLRDRLAEIELVHPEAGDSDVRDHVTDTLCRAWGIETEYRLRFERYDERRGRRT